MAPVGTQYNIFEPNIYVAPTSTILPALSVAFGGGWPTGWFKLNHTTEGCTITPSAGKDDITSDEAGGVIGVVPSGDSDITIGFTPLTPNLDLFSWLSNMQQMQDVAAVAGPPAIPAYKRFALNPTGKQFMFGVEGKMAAGGLTEFGGFVRAFGYKVEQTNDVDINMRKTGDDAVMRLEAEVRCLTTTVVASQLTGTGITQTDNRFDIFVIPATA